MLIGYTKNHAFLLKSEDMTPTSEDLTTTKNPFGYILKLLGLVLCDQIITIAEGIAMKTVKKLFSIALALIIALTCFAMMPAVVMAEERAAGQEPLIAGETPEVTGAAPAESEPPVEEPPAADAEPGANTPAGDTGEPQAEEGQAIQPMGAVTAADDLAIGSTRVFSQPSTSVNRFEGVLAAQSEHALVYVEKQRVIPATGAPYSTYQQLSSLAAFLPDGTTANADAQAIAEEFESMYAFLSTPDAPAYYGEPFDIDGNGKIILYVCDLFMDGKESGSTVGGYVAGLFNANDFVYRPDAGPNVNNDYGDILYLDMANNQGYTKYLNDRQGYFQTIIHEYAHLLSFSAVHKNRLNGINTNSKDVFFEESLAELASYLYTGKFASNRLTYFFTNQFSPRSSFIDWNASGDWVFAHFGAAALMGLEFYNCGGDLHGFINDPRYSKADSRAAFGEHSGLGSFDAFFERFALDTFVSDPSGAGPHLDNVDFDSWDRIDLYNQLVLKPGVDFYFSANRTPYMPPYFALARMGTRLGIEQNVINITLTDALAQSKFYVVYPDAAFTSSLSAATARKYTQLIPGQTMTVPVGQGNEFAILAVNFSSGNTDATVNYTAATNENYPFEQRSTPEAANLKAEHALTNVKLSWEAPENMPEGTSVSGYEVFRDGIRVRNSAASRTYTDSYSGLTVGQQYEYKIVTHMRMQGYSSTVASDGVSVNFTLLPPTVGAPTGLTATQPQVGRVRLEWQEADALYGAAIRRLAAGNTEIYRDGELIKQTSSENYTDTNLTPGAAHVYTLRGYVLSNGEMVYSEFTAPLTVVIGADSGNPGGNPGGGTAQTLEGNKKSGSSVAITGKLLSGLTAGVDLSGGGSAPTARDLTNQFTPPDGGYTIAVMNQNGTEVTPGKPIGTGMTIMLCDAGGQPVDTLTVVIKGDLVGGNGLVRMDDVQKLFRSARNSETLTDAQRAAGDVFAGASAGINMGDAQKLFRVARGREAL
ncbi:MAG TPA: hypothetical protein DEB31_01715 [Clostridiales bacterium]|nr:hypothetical protein [Clostridiales bacterium]